MGESRSTFVLTLEDNLSGSTPDQPATWHIWYMPVMGERVLDSKFFWIKTVNLGNVYSILYIYIHTHVVRLHADIPKVERVHLQLQRCRDKQSVRQGGSQFFKRHFR